ncbi:MAG: hypothetical protein EOO15_09290 [Chitinophagaceae bacterium]|nr:MAG: hypothetical protein EOO15_09290 [Chitinophagaceae bacterium]
MRFFLLHIFLKDCSWPLIYFLILRFNWTGETYLPDTRQNFPEAPDMTFGDMIGAALLLGILPMLVSGFLYFILYVILDKPFERRDRFSALCIGFLLAFSFPVSSVVAGADLVDSKAGTYALVLSFLISIASYYLLNAKVESQHI